MPTTNISITAQNLAEYTAERLNIRVFRDYCPNGLQVAGRPEVKQVLCGVSASRALIEVAIHTGADTILVHHGFFWKNEDPCLVGWKKERIRLLLAHDINLFAYHLPLDAHPELGNNAQLGRKLGLTTRRVTGDNNLISIGETPATTVGELADIISQALDRPPLVIGRLSQPIATVAWCTGGAQGYFNEAIAAGADVYITGEISEQMVDIAHEMGVAFIAAGHYATERYGVQALAADWAKAFNVQWQFMELTNPV